MKLIHLSDLHLGKRLNEYSLVEDQEYILQKILEVVDAEQPNGVIIAGDVYDKAIPSAEAVAMFDGFLVELSRRVADVFVISGNHDSPERIAFGSRIMNAVGIHLSPVYDGTVAPITLTDEYGPLNVYLLPFVKPAHVRRFAEDAEIASYTDAIRYAIEKMNVDTTQRNLLVTHQFVTGARRSESEEISVGGTDNVDVEVFEPFDYVALGHIHSPQTCGREAVRYCGTPLKYSFSEARDQKAVSVVELREKGIVIHRSIPLLPLRDMREIRGTYDELMLRSFYEGTTLPNDYVHVTLTDETDIPDVVSKMRVVYKKLMRLDYDNLRTRSSTTILSDVRAETKTPMELFADLYLLQNNQEMSEEQKAFLATLMEGEQ